jgi:hypothetical protein
MTSGFFTRDQKPWVSLTSEQHRVPDVDGKPDPLRRYRWFYEFEPRPEFDNHNPLLLAFRGNLRHINDEDFAPEDRNLRGVAARWLAYLDNGDQEITDDEATIAHARRIIARVHAHAVANPARSKLIFDSHGDDPDYARFDGQQVTLIDVFRDDDGVMYMVEFPDRSRNTVFPDEVTTLDGRPFKDAQ